MITSQTPFRISFFGGGTDYPDYYLKEGGKTLGLAINKYCYLHVRKLPPFFEQKHRIVYSKIELINTTKEIVHPAVKAVLEYVDLEEGLSVLHDGDIPARSGMASSSAFTVGLLNALYGLQGKLISKQSLAEKAVHIEQNIIQENVGSQDQYLTALGGLNLLEFNQSGEVSITPILMPPERFKDFEKHLLLVFTGLSRVASDVANDQIKKIPGNHGSLKEMKNLVDQAFDVLVDEKSDLRLFGELLNATWKFKKSLSDKISIPMVDELYERALNAGAIGGKLLGAGGGGFMLFFVSPENRKSVVQALKPNLVVPIEVDFSGTRIISHNHL